MASVYFIKNSCGDLLYIGCAESPLSRIYQHKGREWISEATDIKIKYYASKERALRAEARFIRRFQPLHNITHNPRFGFSRLVPSSVNGDAPLHMVLTDRRDFDQVTVEGGKLVINSLDRFFGMPNSPRVLEIKDGFELSSGDRDRVLETGAVIL